MSSFTPINGPLEGFSSREPSPDAIDGANILCRLANAARECVSSPPLRDGEGPVISLPSSPQAALGSSSNTRDETPLREEQQVYGMPAAYAFPGGCRSIAEREATVSVDRVIHQKSPSVSPGSSPIGSSNQSIVAAHDHGDQGLNQEAVPMTGTAVSEPASTETASTARASADTVSADRASAEPVREFICAMDTECKLGQFRLSESRKVVSDYFGRNKFQTRNVEEAYWVRMCRKHYQRTAYRDNYEFNKLLLIGRQLNRILEQKADLRFTVGLKSSEKVRLDRHYAYLSNNGQLFNPNDPAVLIEEPAKAPIVALHAIFAHCGPNKTPAQCSTLLEAVEQMLVNGSIKRIPNFELIPEFPDPVSPANKSKTSRLSNKGAVQKTGKNDNTKRDKHGKHGKGGQSGSGVKSGLSH